jgi:hypothetical protein
VRSGAAEGAAGRSLYVRLRGFPSQLWRQVRTVDRSGVRLQLVLGPARLPAWIQARSQEILEIPARGPRLVAAVVTFFSPLAVMRAIRG